MKRIFKKLKLQQTDRALDSWRNATLAARPPDGWIRTIRESLGLTTVAYAKRLGMTDSGVRTIEKSEANDTITLATLRKMAEAMDCEVKYALVPKQSLSEMRKSQAEHIARKQMESITHSMQLEAQGVEPNMLKLQREDLMEELLSGSGRELWS